LTIVLEVRENKDEMIKAESGKKAKSRARVSDSENHRDGIRDPWSPRLGNRDLLLKKKGETMKAESGKRVSRSRLPVF
jgi:hypothetical protein